MTSSFCKTSAPSPGLVTAGRSTSQSSLGLIRTYRSSSSCQHFGKAQPEFFLWIPRASALCTVFHRHLKGKVSISTFPVFLIDPLSGAGHAAYVDVRRLYDFTPLKITSAPRLYDIRHFTLIFVAPKLGRISGRWRLSWTGCRCEGLLFICFGGGGHVYLFVLFGCFDTFWSSGEELFSSSSWRTPLPFFQNLLQRFLVSDSRIYLNLGFEGETHF